MIYRLRSYHGGLGDELQFSTLPELLTAQGHEVYLLKDPQNKQVMPLRNGSIKELVWDSNPYIKGEIEGEWNLGDIPGVKYINNTGVFIRNWEKAFGADSGWNRFPAIYKKPDDVEAIDVLIELSSLTLNYDAELVKRKVTGMLGMIDWVDKRVGSQPSVLQIHNQYQYAPILLDGIGLITGSLRYIWSLLCHCKVFITLNSGLHSLAAAAKRYNPDLHIRCLLPGKDAEWIREQKKFYFPDIHYIPVNEQSISFE